MVIRRGPWTRTSSATKVRATGPTEIGPPRLYTRAVLFRVLAGLLGLAAVLGLAVAGRVGWVGYGPPPGDAPVRAQVRFLLGAVDDGAGDDMQQLFPEGDYFLRALTAMAAARSPEADLEAARALRDSLDAPESVVVFGSGMVPEHGIFAAGWALLVALDVARIGGQPADLADVRRRAAVVEAALRGSASGFLEGYPGQYWPCDTVVAAAALADAAALLGETGWTRTVRNWRDRVRRQVDPATGLLPHRVDASGRALEGPRGSSQAVIQTYWAHLGRWGLGDQGDADTWAAFRRTFVVREAGLVGVREYPVGVTGAGDVDSGPLLLGVSASASAVTLAAARTVGDVELAEDLDREAELLGLPVRWGDQRRYALGLLPVGDAFLAWARTRPPGTPAEGDWPRVRPWWDVLAVPFLVPVVGLVLVARPGARR